MAISIARESNARREENPSSTTRGIQAHHEENPSSTTWNILEHGDSHKEFRPNMDKATGNRRCNGKSHLRTQQQAMCTVGQGSGHDVCYTAILDLEPLA